MSREVLAHELQDYVLEDMHEILTRNQFYLPNPKCHWVNDSFQFCNSTNFYFDCYF